MLFDWEFVSPEVTSSGRPPTRKTIIILGKRIKLDHKNIKKCKTWPKLLSTLFFQYLIKTRSMFILHISNIVLKNIVRIIPLKTWGTLWRLAEAEWVALPLLGSFLMITSTLHVLHCSQNLYPVVGNIMAGALYI